MKKSVAISIAVFLTLALCACSPGGGQSSSAVEEPSSASAASPSSSATEATSQAGSSSAQEQPSGQPEEPSGSGANARIVFTTQEYIGDNIAEIPYIEYDGENDPEIEMINRALNQGLRQAYEDFMDAYEADREWIEIRSYPFTSDDYLQVVVTSIVYPTYGTDGDMESYNFSKKENRFLSLDDAMSSLGLTEEDITKSVVELYEPEFPSMSVGEVKPVGFLIREGASEPDTLLLLEVVIENTESEPWKSFYAYAPQSKELYALDNSCLFDPHDMDQMDPPLFYQQG